MHFGLQCRATSTACILHVVGQPYVLGESRHIQTWMGKTNAFSHGYRLLGVEDLHVLGISVVRLVRLLACVFSLLLNAGQVVSYRSSEQIETELLD